MVRLALACALAVPSAAAWGQEYEKEFEAFMQAQEQEFDTFRNEVDAEFETFLREAWQEYSNVRQGEAPAGACGYQAGPAQGARCSHAGA